MSLLRQYDRMPDDLLELDASQLHGVLGGPSLIHLSGRRQPPLFVSVLMHGNETGGWDAIRKLLCRYVEQGEIKLPRALSLFIANTAAAAEGLRHLPGQADYNRVWPGGEMSEGEEADTMAEVMEVMSTREIFAAVDVHNNTGMNPHYACCNVLENAALQLAVLFGRTVVYFERPRGVASMAMAALGPSVTLECGKVGSARGVVKALEYLDACLHLSAIPQHPVAAHDIDLFHTVAITRVPDTVAFGFGDNGYTLDFAADLERLNFRELDAGTVFGRVNKTESLPLQVRDEHDRDVTARYFEVRDGQLCTRLPVMPSMLTADVRVIRQDCLCYLMERYDRQLPCNSA